MDLGSFELVWFWVFAVLVVPSLMMVSAFSILNFKYVLVTILDLKTKTLPSFMGPLVRTIKTSITEAFGNIRTYKPKMTELLLFSLIIAVLMLLPALWTLQEQQDRVVTTGSARKKKTN